MLLKMALVVFLTAFQTSDIKLPSDEVKVSERYTPRLKKPGSYSTSSIRKLAISPDGKQVAIATHRELIFANSSDGEVQSRFASSPFAITYSADSKRLVSISEKKGQLFQAPPPSEVPSKFVRPNGYLGVKFGEKSGKLVVTSVEPDSPASKVEQLKPGSELIAIERNSEYSSNSVVGKSVRDVFQKLEGPVNTDVKLTIIPRGQIEDTEVTLTRLSMLPSGQYGLLPKQNTVPVVSCVVGDYHEFRSSSDGNYVASIRTEQIRNDRGRQATSEGGEWFVFVSEYNDADSATIKSIQPDEPDSAKQKETHVQGPAAHKLGYKMMEERVYGAEIFDLQTQKLVASFPIGRDPVAQGGKLLSGVQLSHEKKQLVIGPSSTLHVYDIKTGQRTSTIQPAPYEDSVRYASLAVAKHFAAVGDTRGKVRIVNLNSGKLVETISGREDGIVEYVDFSDDAKVLTYHSDGVVHVVHLQIEE